MCDKELLIAYVYNEIADGDRAQFETHLRACGGCQEEVSGLRDMRKHLAAWAPPQPDLGFRVVQQRSPAASWRAWWAPAWGLAAAAVLVLATAASIANVEVRYGQDGLSVRTGWNRTSVAGAPISASSGSAASTSPAVKPVVSTDLQAEYAAIDRRLRQLEASASRPGMVAASVNTGSRYSDAELLRRVREIVAQSETRQQQELALRVSQVVHDFDTQRANDLVRIQQGLGRIEGLTNAEAVSHRNLANYIYRVSQQQQPK